MTSTRASSSSTTATTRTSNGCSDELGVPTQPSTMSFGVSDGRRLRVQQRFAERPVRESRPRCSRPSFHRMIADLVRFNRDARELLARAEDEPIAGRLARAPALLARVRRAADRPPGVGRVVGRSARRCGLSRRASWSSSSTTTACSDSAIGHAGGRSAGDRALRRGAHAALARAPPAVARRSTGSLATPTMCSCQAARR